jgi:hypothetical protein
MESAPLPPKNGHIRMVTNRLSHIMSCRRSLWEETEEEQLEEYKDIWRGLVAR